MIRILLFAGMKEAAGTDQLEMEAEHVSVSDIRLFMKENYPEIPGTERAMAAVDEEFVPDQEIIRAGGTVAFIPPVSGG
ncbi:MoaD/ThiS family protein [Alkalicoccus luteus]|uniref:Molybdopterin synthase sulfur carrier subunit n=1 Tax=Alkalicoccus luteus TaxID=1237094 RepID=A0A969TV00_9BACI|nr:MoaD/ThiS family protein [Alkalicoccus luteus]NJP37597.1 molybdopterin synthase sulfur carrier subunit [Alkalicoccus luteus]